MGKGVSCVAVTVAALCVVPIATADRVVSVGYRTPAALHGLRVVSRISALRTAEVRVPNARAERALRSRPGIRFTQRVVPRVQADAPIPFTAGLAVPEWQWNAVHADLVPSWVQQAASTITIAIVDTGADVLAPSIAAKNPVTWNVANGASTVHDAIGHGTFVASLAAGTISDANGMSGFGGDARLMIVQANRGGTGFSDVDESAAIVWAVDNGANIINLSLGGAQTSQVERNAIDYATEHGVLLVAAAGNSAEQGNPIVYPAALIGRAGLVVGASNPAGARASFSTTGTLRRRARARRERARRARLRHLEHVLHSGRDARGRRRIRLRQRHVIRSAGDGRCGSARLGGEPERSTQPALPRHSRRPLRTRARGRTTSRFGTIDVAAAVQNATGGTVPVVTRPVVVTKPKPRRRKFARRRKRRSARGRDSGLAFDALDVRAECAQALVDPLVALVDLVGVADRRRAFRAERGDHHRHAGTNVGARHRCP